MGEKDPTVLAIEYKNRPRTNLGGVGDLVVLERVEVVFDVNDWAFLRHPSPEEGIGRTLRGWARFCRLALGGRRLAVSAMQLVHGQRKHKESEGRRITAGANEAVLGVGLKDDAFTFNRSALVGERGAADALLVEEERDAVPPVELAALAAGAGGVTLGRLVLKGGIGCMTIEILFEAALSLPEAALFEDVLMRAEALAPEG